jgi:hypothetical protein
MAEPGHEHDVHRLRRGQHDDGDAHRRADVLPRIEARRQYLDTHQAHQADAVAHQRARGLLHVLRLELAVVEQHRHQRLRKDDQRHRAGQRQQQQHPQAPVEHVRIGLRVLARLRRRQLRQQHHAQRHAEQRGGELHQPVGIGQPGDCADAHVRGDLRVDQQGQLRHRHAHQCRRHAAQDQAHARVLPGGAQRTQADGETRHAADSAQRRNLDRRLQHTADHHPRGQRQHRVQPPGPEGRRSPPGGRDDRDIQQHRRDRRHRKALPGVQDAGGQGHQRHEGDVREHPARHRRGQVELGQAGANGPYQYGRADHAEHTGDQQRPGQHTGHRVDQSARGFVAVALARGGQDRHEGLRERALGKQPAQQVGDAEGDVEGVGGGAGAEGRGDQLLAHQTGDARDQREQGDGGSGLQQVHRRPTARRGPCSSGGGL